MYNKPQGITLFSVVIIKKNGGLFNLLTLFFCSLNRIFAAEINKTNMELAINNSIYRQAADYAKQQGLILTEVIEGFLVRFIGHSKAATEQPVPDIVMSLFGAGESIAEDDLNAREAYYQYLEEKYK
jgi:hypothetical protein